MLETTLGTRTLKGDEARLVKEGISLLIDAIYGEQDLGVPINYGIPVFEYLTPPQKLYYLCRVSRAMLIDDVDPLPKSAPHEATIAAIYRLIRDHVEIEIDMQAEENDPEMVDTSFRALVANAVQEMQPESTCPDPECVLMDEWEVMIEVTQGFVLPDEDWQMNTDFLDANPDNADVLKEWMGVDPDYFTTIPPDDAQLNVEQYVAELIQLSRG